MHHLKSLSRALAVVLGFSGALLAQNRAAWMQEAQWGVMTRYLADWQARVHGLTMSVDEWNKLVDGFDAEGIARQLASADARYYQITIGQNSDHAERESGEAAAPHLRHNKTGHNVNRRY